MFPKNTSDIITSVAEDTGFDETDVKELVYYFYQKFIPRTLRSLEHNSVCIKHLGTFEVDLGNLKGLLNRRRFSYKKMLAENHPALEDMKAELDLIEQVYQETYNKRESIKQHYNEYKERSKQYQEDMAKQREDSRGHKE